MDGTALTPSAGVVRNPVGTLAPSLLRPAAVACLAGTVPTLPSYSVPTFHQTMLSVHSVLLKQAKPGSIAFFGDSITQEINTQDITSFGMNFGVSGLTPDGLLAKIDQYRECLDYAGATVLLIGINSLRTDTPNLTNVKDWMLKTVTWLTGPLVWIKILHTGTPEPDRNSNIDNVNSYIAGQLASRPNTAIVDVNPTLAPSGVLLPAYHGGDGLHPNGAGQAVITAAVRTALKTLIA